MQGKMLAASVSRLWLQERDPGCRARLAPRLSPPLTPARKGQR